MQNSSRSARFATSETPWLRAPLECAADGEIIECVIVAPTGAGKSAIAEAIIPYIVAEDPGNLLYASQTDPDAGFWAETRLVPTLKQCGPLDGLWPSDRHKSRKMEIIFSHMAMVIGGANLSNFQEKSCRWLYGDEVWNWGGKDVGGGGLIREFLARHHNRWNRKIYLVSQGSRINTEFHGEWEKCHQADYSWKCQKCHTPQIYSWDSLRYDTIERPDGTTDEEATSETARMECIFCRAQYRDTAIHRRMLAASNTGNGHNGYIMRGNPGALKGYVGYHIDSLAVFDVPWAQEVLGFLESKRMLRSGIVDKYRQWWQKRRANFWADDLADTKVELTRGVFTKLEHEDGKPIDGEAARFFTVDSHMTHFWGIVQAWRPGGSSRILWEGYIPGDGKDEAGVTEIQNRYGVLPGCVLIDISYDWDRIVGLCAKHGWMGVKGEGMKRFYPYVRGDGKTIERLHSKTMRTKSKAGPIVPYVELATNPIKDIVHRLLIGEGAALEIPSDVSKAFEQHMRSERREMVKQATTKQESTSVWVCKNRNNHLWDCLVYQVGAALIFGLFQEPARDTTLTETETP
jgi:phage terminase large subunit GpA-like protein